MEPSNVCGAIPYTVLASEDFDLQRLNADGVPPASPNPGFWYCLERCP
jgi:hypothetical protein